MDLGAVGLGEGVVFLFFHGLAKGFPMLHEVPVRLSVSVVYVRLLSQTVGFPSGTARMETFTSMRPFRQSFETLSVKQQSLSRQGLGSF